MIMTTRHVLCPAWLTTGLNLCTFLIETRTRSGSQSTIRFVRVGVVLCFIQTSLISQLESNT